MLLLYFTTLLHNSVLQLCFTTLFYNYRYPKNSDPHEVKCVLGIPQTRNCISTFLFVHCVRHCAQRASCNHCSGSPCRPSPLSQPLPLRKQSQWSFINGMSCPRSDHTAAAAPCPVRRAPHVWVEPAAESLSASNGAREKLLVL